MNHHHQDNKENKLEELAESLRTALAENEQQRATIGELERRLIVPLYAMSWGHWSAYAQSMPLLLSRRRRAL